MDIKKLKQSIKDIRKCINVIAVERDKLRDIIEEAEEIAESADEAVSDFQDGLDKLSQYL
jgi:septal ring factor EnvC (AmiA/AmiB activator)